MRNYNTAHFAERVIYNYLNTHRTIRQLAQYYKIPKSTIADILKRAEDKVEWDLYRRYKSEAEMHRRAQCMRWNGQEEYFMIDEDGPMD